MSCFYKCELSVLPGKLFRPFYIFGLEIAHWLQFGITKMFVCALIEILKKMPLACKKMNASESPEPWR